MITINFILTKEDYFQFYYYTLWLEPGKKSAAFKSRIRSFLFCAFSLFFVKLVVSKFTFDIYFFYSLFVIATIFLLPLFYMKEQQKKQAKLFCDGPLNQKIFSETGIFGKYAWADANYKWISIVKKAETTEHYFLYINAIQALIIPKRALKSEIGKLKLENLFKQHISFEAEVGHLVQD